MTKPFLKESEVEELCQDAHNLRKTCIKMATRAGTGHLAPALDLVEILLILYKRVMDYRVKDPRWEDRDRFILSKGHACIALYAILAEVGFFEKDRLKTFCRELNTLLGGHPEIKVPGIEANTGSLGHGFPIGIGMAIKGKATEKKYRVYTVLGDGESQEGTIWEGAMAASHLGLDNLVAILDRNRLQVSGFTEDVMELSPLEEKWRSFGWGVKVVDGHDFQELNQAFGSLPFKEGSPSIIIASTVKGKGLSFAENRVEWHYKVPNQEEYRRAQEELGLGGLDDED